MSDQDKIYIDPEEDAALEERTGKKVLRMLVFSLGKENYCVDVRQAKEVMKMPETTRVPNVPSFVLGVANLRGEIISILDLHYFFGLDPLGKSQDVRVIVSDLTGEAVGLRVDRVKDTLEIDETTVQPPLATLRGKFADFTKGQIPSGNDILILVDFERILQSEEIRNLRKGESA